MGKIGQNRRSKVLTSQKIRNKKKHDCDNRPQTAPGFVPKYLKDYQNEWKLKEKERREMVKTLLETQAELHKQLVTIGSKDTLRSKKMKEDILKRLTEVDEAMKVFGRRKVFIKISG